MLVLHVDSSAHTDITFDNIHLAHLSRIIQFLESGDPLAGLDCPTMENIALTPRVYLLPVEWSLSDG